MMTATWEEGSEVPLLLNKVVVDCGDDRIQVESSSPRLKPWMATSGEKD
jgi:hypothetical protein